MQILILSDIHANWHALNAVLEDAEGQYGSTVCCGDLVGYNAQPATVLDWTRSNCAHVIRGNHDKLAAGLADLEWFNEVAQQSGSWTREQLSAEQLGWLKKLDEGPIYTDGFAVWHGSPADEDEYLTTPEEARPRFSAMEEHVGFFGHTHLQGGFMMRHGTVSRIPQVKRKERESVLQLDPDASYMINPGAVGQPRDRDARAAYVLYDPAAKVVTYRRVEYPISKTVDEIRAAGLPDTLGLRLMIGF